MSDLKIRPSTTLILARYILAALIVAVIAWFGFTSRLESKLWMAAFAVPALIAISAASKHLRAAHTTMELVGDRLKFELGMLSKTSRSVPLSKVQDVTVKQTLGQRLLGIGDLTIESAGESGRLQIQDIASPRVVAEQILDRVAQLNPNRKQS